MLFFFFKQKTAYEMRISDWSSDVCSSDLVRFTCIQALQPLHRLGGIAVPEFPEDATDFAGMQEQIAATLAILDAVDRTALGDDGDSPVSFELPNGMIFYMSAFDYVRDWAAPQFAFHHVAANSVLAQMGVQPGKADHVGL